MRHKSYSQTRPSPWQYVVLAGLAVLFVYPIWWAISSSLKPANDIVRSPLSFSPGSLTLDNYRAMLDDVPLGTGFLNTLLVVAVKGTLTMCLCPLAGYAFAKYRFPGRNLLFGILMLTLMLPTLVLIIPLLLQMSQLGWVNTYQALILPGSIDAFSIFWMRQTIAAVPDELLDAGRVDGAGELRIFARIVVPVIRPGIAALGVLTVMNIYNDFVWPVVAVNDENHQTLQVVLSTLAQNVTGNRIGADFSTVWGEL
ncbi:carbohydrate ABC transporter permease, partial [Streptomyces vinaceusdrappus]